MFLLICQNSLASQFSVCKLSIMAIGFSPKKKSLCIMGTKFLSKRNPINSLYIFILNVNFKILIVGLHVFIISFVLEKFQEDQRSIAMSSNKC